MNPLSGMHAQPASDTPLDLLAATGAPGGDAAGGFADALQRATGERRPDSTKQPRVDRTDSSRAKPARAPHDGALGPDVADAASPPDADRVGRQSPRHARPDDDADAITDPAILAGLPQGTLPAQATTVAPEGDAKALAATAGRDPIAIREDRGSGPTPDARARHASAMASGEHAEAPGAGITPADSARAAARAAGTTSAADATDATARPDAARSDVAGAEAGRPDAADARTPGDAEQVAGSGRRPAGRAEGREAAAEAVSAASAARTPLARAAVPATTVAPADVAAGARPVDPAAAGGAARRPAAATAAISRADGPSNAAAGREAMAARATPDASAVPPSTEARAAQSTEPAGPAAVATNGAEDGLDTSLLGGADTAAPIAHAPGSAVAPGAMRPVALPVAAPVFSPAFPQALGQQLVLALRMELGQAELILSPAELGPVRVGLSLDGNAASIQFAAPNADTRQALEQSLTDLRDLLAEHGLSLADTHVGPGFHRNGDERPTDGAAPGRSERRAPGTTETVSRPIGMPVRPDALVDLFA